MIQPDSNTSESSEEQRSIGPKPASGYQHAAHAPAQQQVESVGLEGCLAQLTEVRREADEYKNRYLRAAAEVENARKQAERNAAARGLQEKRHLLLEFLEVADSLERALSQPSSKTDLYDGVKLALRQLQQALARAGVERMEIKEGDTFDPVYHEAVEVRAGNTPHDTVVDVVRAGYMHDGTVLRPAQVIVARGRSG
jgi:molecular chaperone GrpE